MRDEEMFHEHYNKHHIRSSRLNPFVRKILTLVFIGVAGMALGYVLSEQPQHTPSSAAIINDKDFSKECLDNFTVEVVSPGPPDGAQPLRDSNSKRDGLTTKEAR